MASDGLTWREREARNIAALSLLPDLDPTTPYTKDQIKRACNASHNTIALNTLCSNCTDFDITFPWLPQKSEHGTLKGGGSIGTVMDVRECAFHCPICKAVSGLLSKYEQKHPNWYTDFMSNHGNRIWARKMEVHLYPVRADHHDGMGFMMPNVARGVVLANYIDVQILDAQGKTTHTIHDGTMLASGGLGCLTNRADSGKPLSGRLVPRVIDYKVLQESLGSCLENHNICGPDPHTSMRYLYADFWVIDVINLCVRLVPHEKAKYVALSYVWGKAHGSYDHFSGTPLDDNRTSFALPSNLPETISDSIKFCKGMGVEYLWVDAVCINQHNVDVKMASIAKMDTIYMRAYFTIIAAGKDAYAGLPGVRPRTREDVREVMHVKGVELMPILPSFVDHLKGSVWSTRGWTMQEGFLSSRCFFITPDEVFYACVKSLNRESLHSLAPDISRGVSNVTSSIAAFPVLRASPRNFNSIFSDYSKRQLTSQDDALNAIKGIMNVLSVGSPYSFHWGNPVENGNILGGMCWFHWMSGINPVLRRPQFPTYSWMHWRHNPHFDHDVEEMDPYFAGATLMDPEESLESVAESARGIQYIGPSAMLYLEPLGEMTPKQWKLDESRSTGFVRGGWWPATLTFAEVLSDEEVKEIKKGPNEFLGLARGVRSDGPGEVVLAMLIRRCNGYVERRALMGMFAYGWDSAIPKLVEEVIR